MGFTTHLWKCNKCDKQILYTSRQNHPSINHKCKLKERKQMEPENFYHLNKVLHHKGCLVNNGDQYDYWKKRINERIKYLTPLMDELKSKGISLATLSKELHQEWIELIEVKEYFKF
jgi:hypothetical protein